MSIEMQKMHERASTPDRTSSISATETAVNTPDKSLFPQNAAQPDNDSLDSSFISISSNSGDDEDEDEDEYDNPSAKGQLPEDAVEGWPQLAQLMADTPDFAAFPRFRDLNIKSLLYYQAELNGLRKQLHRLEHEDKAAPDRRKNYSLYADHLVSEVASEQLETIRKMRTVLKEYNKALLQYSQICALPDPEPYNMRTLRRWLKNGDCGNHNVRSLADGGAVNTWGLLKNNPDDKDRSMWSQFGSLLWGLIWMRRPTKSAYEPDLALTAPQTQVDGLTHWYASEWIPFRRAFTSRKERNENQDPSDPEQNPDKEVINIKRKEAKKEETLVSWSENSALRLTSGISTVVACLLPVIAISVLSQLQGLKALLVCLAGFSLVFAIGLIALTQGTSKRTEIFGATAAFSAVMVVFISIPPAPVIYMPPGSTIPSVFPSAVISALPTR